MLVSSGGVLARNEVISKLENLKALTVSLTWRFASYFTIASSYVMEGSIYLGGGVVFCFLRI